MKQKQANREYQPKIVDGEVRKAVLDEDETARAKKRIAEKLEKLRRGDR